MHPMVPLCGHCPSHHHFCPSMVLGLSIYGGALSFHGGWLIMVVCDQGSWVMSAIVDMSVRCGWLIRSGHLLCWHVCGVSFHGCVCPPPPCIVAVWQLACPSVVGCYPICTGGSVLIWRVSSLGTGIWWYIWLLWLLVGGLCLP